MMNLMNIQYELQNIVNTKEECSKRIGKIQSILEDVKKNFPKDTPQFLACTSTIYEAMGDVWMQNNPIEAEKSYKEMFKESKKLYDLDAEKYDYRYGFSAYKMASYYQNMLRCNKLEEKEKVFNEMQQKVFGICDGLFKTALSATLENAKKGYVQYLQLHAMITSDLALLHASVKDYKTAIQYGVEGVNISKSVYESNKVKEYLFTLINRINTLATLYKLIQKENKTIVYLKESIAYAKEKIEEDPVVIHMMIGKCYMNMAECYLMKEEILNADQCNENALEHIAQANKASDYKMHQDVIRTYIKVGEHYKKTGRDAIANSYYNIAMSKATYLYEESKDASYVSILKELYDLIRKQGE